MKKSLLLLFLASTLFAQYQVESETPLKVSVKDMNNTSSTITNIDGYNTYSHAGIPVGILEYEDVNTSVNIGYNRMGLKDASNSDSSWAINSISIPYIRIGAPDKIYLDAFYSINPIQSTQLNSSTNKLRSTSSPFSRFGFQLVGEVPDGSFRIGVGGTGYLGTEKWHEDGNRRSILGAEDVGLCFAFRLQEFVNLSFSATTGGYLDSLFRENQSNLPKTSRSREIFAYWKIPQFDVAIDIGKDEFPYLSNFVFSFAKSNFTYSLRSIYGSGPLFNSNISQGWDGDQADAIVTDSMALNWKNIWIADAGDVGIFKPALSIGMFHKWHEHNKPDRGDNIPFGPVLKGAEPGYEYQIGSFNFGLGINYSMKNIFDTWFEYGLSTLSMDEIGDKINDYINSGSTDDFIPDGHAYHRIGLGIKTSFNKWPVINMPDDIELSLLFGFMMRQENKLYGNYGDWPLNLMYTLNDNNGPVELDNRYRPWRVMANEVKTTNVTFGLEASFMDKMFETDIHLGILRQTQFSNYNASYIDSNNKYKGLEFGLDLTYNQRKISKKKPATSLAPKSPTATDPVKPANTETPATN